MRDSKAIQGVAALVTLGAVGVIVFTLRGGFAPGIDRKPHEAAGWGMARQAVLLLEAGGQVMIVTRDTSAFTHPATDIQLAAFKKELGKANVTISAIQALQVDPLRPMEVPPGDFLEWIRKSPKGSVIVSFMGPPSLSQAQRNQLREIKPAIVAFCPGGVADRTDLRALFGQGLLHAAVVSRRHQPSSSAKPQGLQGWFDQSFMTITAAEVGAVSWKAGAETN